MFSQCELVILILVLTLDGQVHTGEIFGGHEAVPHSRPYMLILERHMKNNEKRYCDGFLLNEEFVMTAAHCQAKSYTVILGVHNFHNSNGQQRLPVKESFPHEDYDAADFKNDIMLLKLSSKANYSTSVKPIDLAGPDDVSPPKSCLVSGWGRTDRDDEHGSNVLMEVSVTLLEQKRCPRETLYCSEGESGPGNGDSGGPLVCEDGKARGVVCASYKPDLHSPEMYTFTKISGYRSWIDSIMGHH